MRMNSRLRAPARLMSSRAPIGPSGSSLRHSHLRLSTSLDWLPRPYLRAINNVAVDVGAYDRPTADLIESGLQSVGVWRTHVGWRPFAGSGFYVDVGYGLLALGGETRPEDVLVALIGIDPPGDGGELGRHYTVGSLLHLADVELGWQWTVRERWTARAVLSGAFTFNSAPRWSPTTSPACPSSPRPSPASPRTS